MQCGENELAFFKLTDMDVEGEENCSDRDGNPRYVFYIIVGASVSEPYETK